jgi:hypothetical protein
MAQTKDQVWSGFIERALAMLAHAADDRRSWDSGLNTHDQREFRPDRESRVRNGELAGAEIPESLDRRCYLDSCNR